MARIKLKCSFDQKLSETCLNKFKNKAVTTSVLSKVYAGANSPKNFARK